MNAMRRSAAAAARWSPRRSLCSSSSSSSAAATAAGARASSWWRTLGKVLAGSIVAASGGSALVGLATRAPHEQPTWFTLCAPLMRALLDGEAAHRAAVHLLRLPTLVRRACLCVDARADPSQLAVHLWGMHFANPIGIAAGFDKHAEAVQGVLDVGFGFVEVGSVTPLPQQGNPKPRVFRLVRDRAVINRYGFNSDGHAAVRQRLQQHQQQQRGGGGGGRSGVVGVNLGRNKHSSSAELDYVSGVEQLGAAADYIVVNVSSPNTPGLRSMQQRDALLSLLQRVKHQRDQLEPSPRTKRPPPLLVKIAPDLTSKDKADIAFVAKAVGIDGIIVSNTTTSRPDSLVSSSRNESGGLSGEPLMELSTECLREMYRLTAGQIPLIGVGGVSTGEDAYRKIRAGASLVQLYTSFVYGGPPLIRRIKDDLAEHLRSDGFSCVSDAVGVDA